MGEDIHALLVDDNASDAELSLEALGTVFAAARVRHVEDGAAALEAIFGAKGFAGTGRAAPRLIVLDMKLPKMGGLEVLQRLKADQRTRMIPVMMLTSSKEIEDVAAALFAGANSFVVKPVSYEEYLDKIGKAAYYWARINEPLGRA